MVPKKSHEISLAVIMNFKNFFWPLQSKAEGILKETKLGLVHQNI